MPDKFVNAAETLAFYVTGVIDKANFAIASLTKAIRECECPLDALESMENAKRCCMEIKRDGYIVSDYRGNELNNGYYNIRDYLQDICSGMNNYLSGLFDVDIQYRLNEEDNVNLIFDAKCVEKAVYDGVFGLLCEAGVKNRRVSVYARDLSKYLKICMRCDGASRKDRIFPEREILFSAYGDEGLGSYAEFAMERLGGKYKCIYGKNDGKIELYIPKTFKLNQKILKEQDCKIVNGEKVMVHKVYNKFKLEQIFGGLKER